MSSSFRRSPTLGDTMRGLGILLLVCGTAAMVAAFWFPISIPPDIGARQDAMLAAIKGMTEDQARPIIEAYNQPQSPVANLDRMAIRGMLHMSAMGSTLVGAILFAASELKNALVGRAP